MNNFKTYHPISNFIYFFVVILFSMLFWNPFLILVSVICAFLYSIKLNGKKALKFNFIYALPFALFCALLTPLFNHEGATILYYFPNQNPLTKEALFSGLTSGGMLMCVFLWFSCFNAVMNSSKFVYLFSKISPSIALILSMVLGFVPKFINQFKKIAENKMLSTTKEAPKGLKEKTRFYSKVLSSLITWSLENSMQTAENMKSRGYGIENTKKRTFFTPYEFKKRDALFVFYFLFFSVFFILGIIKGKLDFSFYPLISYSEFDLYTISTYVAFFLMCTSPFICERRIKNAKRNIKN